MRQIVRRAWTGFKSTLVLQAEEYRASVQALNLFFGAIIGVSFAGAVGLPLEDYSVLLFITAMIVTIILIVSNSRRRFYSFAQLGLVMLGAWYVFVREPFMDGIPATLFPTLAVWSLLAALTEFTPREKRDRGAGDS